MVSTNTYEKALSVQVYDGEVVLSTPEGPFSASLTPAAAARTAEVLAEAAKSALADQESQDRTERD